MAASTKRFTLTSAAYTDVSEGANRVWFVLPFDRNHLDAIRVALGASAPAADTIHAQFINSAGFFVGPADYSQEVPVSFGGLASTDRVWVRAESNPVELVVHRQ